MKAIQFKIRFAFLGLITMVVLAQGVVAKEAPPLLIAYFVPSDRVAIPGYVERIDRLMQEVQRFYREGMATNGYGPLTFSLDREEDGKLKIWKVQGKEPMLTYGRNSSGAVRNEVKAGLLAKGVNPDARVLVIFQVLLDRQGVKTTEIGSYVGAGDYYSGTAWFYDDEKLDPALLGSKGPGGYYASREVSLGEFNSHYIGGIAHELGHAFGLPHVAGAAGERRHSLMGDGNHTYGQELRKEGAGSYLHPASALLLARCRALTGDLPGGRTQLKAAFNGLKAAYETNTLILDGVLASTPPAFAVIGYNDNKAIAGDYDATGWVAKVDAAGKFELRIGDIRPGSFELRLQVVGVNGATRTFPIAYTVDGNGIPDTSAFKSGEEGGVK